MHTRNGALNVVRTFLTVRVGQKRIYTPYMTVCMVISLLKHRMYTVFTYKYMVLAHLTYSHVDTLLDTLT
jgi:hypothetical protein